VTSAPAAWIPGTSLTIFSRVGYRLMCRAASERRPEPSGCLHWDGQAHRRGAARRRPDALPELIE